MADQKWQKENDPLMLRTKLEDIVVHKFASGVRPAYMISHDTPLREALVKMRDLKVRSLPVFVPREEESITGVKYEFVSIVSVLDILLWFAWKSEGSDSSKVTIGDFAGVTKESKVLWTYPGKLRLDAVLQPFVAGVHTILVDFKEADEERDRSKIVPVVLSQTDVVRYMIDHMDKLQQSLIDSTLEDVKLVGIWKPVWCMQQDRLAIDCFRSMADESISAIAIVQKDNTLCGTLSSADARAIVSEDLEDKLKTMNVMDFLKHINSPGCGEQHTVTPRTTLREVMHIFGDKHLHRIWVVNEAGAPISCVTLSDIICKFSIYDFYGS